MDVFGGLEASAFGFEAIGAIEGNRQWVQLPDIPQLIVQHWELQQAYGSDVTNNDEYGNGGSNCKTQ